MGISDHMMGFMRNKGWDGRAHDKDIASRLEMPLPPIFQGEIIADKQMPVAELNAFFAAQPKMSQEGAAEFLDDINEARGAEYRSVWD